MELDPCRTALIALDLQAGVMARSFEPNSAQAVLAGALRIGRALVSRGGLVFSARSEWTGDFLDAPRQRVEIPMPIFATGQAAGWSDLAPELEWISTGAITKRQWNAFYGTELDLQLRRRGIGTLIFAGVATNFAVESTARAGWERGYTQIFAVDALASTSRALHEFSCEHILPRLGTRHACDEIVGAIEGTGSGRA